MKKVCRYLSKNFVLEMAWQWLTLFSTSKQVSRMQKTATKKEWHYIVQSMTDQHGVTLECMIQEKISVLCHMEAEEINAEV